MRSVCCPSLNTRVLARAGCWVCGSQRYFMMDVVACFPVDMMLRLMQGVFWCSFKLPSGCETATQQDALTLLRMLRLLRLVKVFKLISFGPLKQVSVGAQSWLCWSGSEK